jgi:DNA-binding NtrC family response regulator
VASPNKTSTTVPVPADDDRAISLVVVGPGLPRVVPLTSGIELKIGRSSTADIVIEEASLSRYHAAVRLRDRHLEIEDLGSSNGTVVRGTALAPGERVRLAIGETVQLGTVLILTQRRRGSPGDHDLPTATAAPRDELVERIAASTISVLLVGEPGVGKGVMAQRIHDKSPRRERPFVHVSCESLLPSVLDAELFGHERRAGGSARKPGLIEAASGGTLFLDEIGETDPEVQLRLLHVLASVEPQRIGAARHTIGDVRIISSTNRSPEKQIEAGTLRADLYYRLAAFTITVPPLRQRRSELRSLANELVSESSGAALPALQPEVIARLESHDWPGNVRELRNVIERAQVLAGGSELRSADIDRAIQLEPINRRSQPVRVSRPTLEGDPDRARILAILDACGGNQSMAAEKLGISRRALVYRLQAWGMTRPRRR